MEDFKTQVNGSRNGGGVHRCAFGLLDLVERRLDFATVLVGFVATHEVWLDQFPMPTDFEAPPKPFRKDIWTLHVVVGSITVLAFVLTGQYLEHNFPGLYASNEAIRYMFRANHVYILFSGLLNFTVGSYGVLSDDRWSRRMQQVGSWLLLVTPVLFAVAFFVEPPNGSPERPMTLAAALMHLDVIRIMSGKASPVSGQVAIPQRSPRKL